MWESISLVSMGEGSCSGEQQPVLKRTGLNEEKTKVPEPHIWAVTQMYVLRKKRPPLGASHNDSSVGTKEKMKKKEHAIFLVWKWFLPDQRVISGGLGLQKNAQWIFHHSFESSLFSHLIASLSSSFHRVCTLSFMCDAGVGQGVSVSWKFEASARLVSQSPRNSQSLALGFGVTDAAVLDIRVGAKGQTLVLMLE